MSAFGFVAGRVLVVTVGCIVGCVYLISFKKVSGVWDLNGFRG